MVRAVTSNRQVILSTTLANIPAAGPSRRSQDKGSPSFFTISAYEVSKSLDKKRIFIPIDFLWLFSHKVSFQP